MLAGVVIRQLRGDDRVGPFSAGANGAGETSFLREQALRDHVSGLSRTYVAVLGSTIVGYVTFLPGAVTHTKLAPALPHLPQQSIPVLILARMGTHRDHQGKGVARALVTGLVFRRAAELARGFGCAGVYLDARPTALGLYDTLCFKPLRPPDGRTPTPMFLPLGACASAVTELTVED